MEGSPWCEVLAPDSARTRASRGRSLCQSAVSSIQPSSKSAPVTAVEEDEIKTARRVIEEGSSFPLPLQTAWRDKVGSGSGSKCKYAGAPQLKRWVGGVRRQARMFRRILRRTLRFGPCAAQGPALWGGHAALTPSLRKTRPA
eukprot:scaffold1062_cov119-Isochrysis_galbana.AAC.2